MSEKEREKELKIEIYFFVAVVASEKIRGKEVRNWMGFGLTQLHSP